MKKVITIGVFLVFFISCKQNKKQVLYANDYEKEVYAVINEGYLPFLLVLLEEAKEYNKADKQLFEVPIPIEQIHMAKFKKYISKEYTFTKENLEKIALWEDHKLDQVLLIKNELREKLYKLREDNDAMFMKNSFENTKEYIEAVKYYFDLWEQEIGLSYTSITVPVFNVNFDKAIMHTVRHDSGHCGFGSDGWYEFEKTNGKWKMARDLLELD